MFISDVFIISYRVFQMCLSAGVGLGSGSRRKLSFKNVSNVVVQLLHSIKFNVDVPFSNMAASPQELKANAARKVLSHLHTSTRVHFIYRMILDGAQWLCTVFIILNV